MRFKQRLMAMGDDRGWDKFDGPSGNRRWSEDGRRCVHWGCAKTSQEKASTEVHYRKNFSDTMRHKIFQHSALQKPPGDCMWWGSPERLLAQDSVYRLVRCTAPAGEESILGGWRRSSAPETRGGAVWKRGTCGLRHVLPWKSSLF